MSDLAYSKKLCGLKKYFINYKDKGKWNPLFPRVEIKTFEMAVGEKSILSEFMHDYSDDITKNAKKLLFMHQPKTENWDLSYFNNKEEPPPNPDLTDAELWVIKEMVRLSCKYEGRGDYGLEGYFRACFKNPWELLNWRNFIDNVDSNVPTWIKNKSELHIDIYRILRKAKKWDLNEIDRIAAELEKDYHEVSNTYHEVINLCLKHGSSETAKILRDKALPYDESDTGKDDSEISTDKTVLKESIKSRMQNIGTESFSDQEALFLLDELRKPLGEIIYELSPSEWQLMDFNYDKSFNTSRLMDLNNEVYNKIKNELGITKENDLYNKLKAITKKVIRNFKNEYSGIVETYNLTDSVIKTMIEDYYFCTRLTEY